MMIPHRGVFVLYTWGIASYVTRDVLYNYVHNCSGVLRVEFIADKLHICCVYLAKDYLSCSRCDGPFHVQPT